MALLPGPAAPAPRHPARAQALSSRGKRRRRGSWRGRQALVGLLLVGGGTGLLAALMQIPERLDALLLVSTAIANVIAGLSRLALGVLQLGGVLLVALLALLALLLLVGGAVRLLRALAPGPLSHADAAAKGPPAARRTTGR